MRRKTYLGGVRVGLANASFPFAKLIIEGENIIILSIFGSVYFHKTDILEIKREQGLISQGIKLTHNVQGYNKNICFWYFGNIQSIIDDIHNLSPIKLEKGISLNDIRTFQNQGVCPIKKKLVLILFSIYIASLLFDGYMLTTLFTEWNSYGVIEIYPIFLASLVSGIAILLSLLSILFFKGIKKKILKREITNVFFKLSLYSLIVFYTLFVFVLYFVYSLFNSG